MIKNNIIIGIIILCLSSIALANPEYQIAPASKWVVEIGLEKPGSYPTDSITDGTYFLLVDTQENPKAWNRESYRRYAEMVVNQKGVSTVSQISIDFDPSYQELIVHSIKLHRNEKVIDKLRLADISILQREKNLEAQLYDGRKTFNVILDDIQVNDIIEYSYSLRGENPVFNGKYYKNVELQWKVPVYKVQHRLLWPKNADLYLKLHKSKIQPVIKLQGEFKEYLFSIDHVPALVDDGDLPDWYNPYPWVQFSEIDTWQHIINWGKELYQVPQYLSPELNEKIREINTLKIQPEDKLLATFRFVQDEIRYMGIETGSGSHKPHKPSQVLQRRFGDCKDKSLLTVTMLRHMGIEADLAFVSTHNFSQIKEWHPSPLAFNHVLLRAKIDDKHYWLDPTRAYQRGSLDQLYQPDYGFALLLNEGYKALIQMSPSQFEFPTKEVNETFDLRNGYNDSIIFNIETTYRSELADYYRKKFSVESMKELEKSYLNYYASEYTKIKANASMVVKDDPVKNELITKESYTIDDFWEHSEEQSLLKAAFYPLEFYDLFKKPTIKQRLMPLKLWHPIYSVLSTEILLPEEWEIEPSKVRIEDDAIAFNNTVEYRNKRLNITYEYKTKKDHLPPDKVHQYLKNLDKINQELGYVITKYDLSWQKNMNWSVGLLAILLFGVALFSAIKIYYYQPKGFQRPGNIDPKFHGIGGWLILVGLSISIQPLYLAWQIFNSFDVYFLNTWRLLTTPGTESYHFLWQPLLIYELSTNIAWLVFSILIAILFFQKRCFFPRFYIWYLFLTLGAQLIDWVIGSNIPAVLREWTSKDTANLVKYGISVIIWCLYFTKSKRVKSTFVEVKETKQSDMAHTPIVSPQV